MNEKPLPPDKEPVPQFSTRHIFYWMAIIAVILAISSRTISVFIENTDVNFVAQGLRPLFWVLNLDHHLPNFPEKISYPNEPNAIFEIWNMLILFLTFIASWIAVIFSIVRLLMFIKPKRKNLSETK